MPDVNQEKISRSIARYIRGAQKTVTILFTDIEDSTKHWEKHGDVKGRLIIDQHNRLLFPVISRFRGRIVKTIGDAVMASFKDPSRALKAAIAIQQFLRNEQQHDPEFKLRVRIGIHTGEAIVEKNDVFGDVVNTASRVEEFGEGGDITLSKDTADRLKKKEFHLVGRSKFIPRGKQSPLVVYQCTWEDHADLTAGISSNSFFQIVIRQKLELLFYAISGLAFFYALYQFYARFFIGYLRNKAAMGLPPILTSIVLTLVFAGALFGGRALLRLKTLPHLFLKALRGGFGACLGFLLLYVPATTYPGVFPEKFEQELFAFDRHFVEILEDNVSVRRAPAFGAEILEKVQSDRLLFLLEETRASRVVWNRVPVDKRTSGWVVRTVPAKIGVPMKVVSQPVRFAFHFRDALSLFAALAGFAWGLFTFKIRPA